MPPSVRPMTVTLVSLLALIPIGLAMSLFQPWTPMSRVGLLHCAGAAIMLSVAYVLIVQAMRFGEIAVVAPFRYSFLLWALLIQLIVFSAPPDAFTLIGSALLVATGVYTLYRERRVKGEAAAAASATSTTVPPPA
jgi:drug/metabolite transporter (DMT)-like permease